MILNKNVEMIPRCGSTELWLYAFKGVLSDIFLSVALFEEI